MSGATTPQDRARLALDDILAQQCDAQQHLLVAATLLAQIARTEQEGNVLLNIIHARKALERAQRGTQVLHANGRELAP